MRVRLRQIKALPRERRHDAIPDKGRWLRATVRGYFAYHAVPTDIRAIRGVCRHASDSFLRGLRRRSKRAELARNRQPAIANNWLPSPRPLNPRPSGASLLTPPRGGPNV